MRKFVIKTTIKNQIYPNLDVFPRCQFRVSGNFTSFSIYKKKRTHNKKLLKERQI
jgi:hypothetical protein